MNIPTINEISPTNLLNLDERTACEHFFGKTLLEARILFGKSEVYADDLIWMGRPAFEYYVQAYIDYLNLSECGDLDFRVPMTVVMGRFYLEDSFDGIRRLIKTISNKKIECFCVSNDNFTRDYHRIAEEIMRK
jgi:hypothetical protein